MKNPNRTRKWRKRWKALHARLQLPKAHDETGKPVQPSEPQPDGALKTLTTLLDSLAHFAERQFNFFSDGFGFPPDTASTGQAVRYHLEPSADFPPEYVLRTLVDQTAFDTEVIQRAYTQRTGALSTPDMRTNLQRGDRLAYDALQSTVALPQPTTVLTYFQKAANVRIIPYAPVALVGIPATVTGNPQDYLAIPHEVGHYIYRFGATDANGTPGQPLRTVLRQRLAGQPNWLQNWLEEIFADVYGCMIAGPAMALNFHDLLTDGPRAEFVRDDGEHPVPAVRAYIYTRTLRNMGMEDVARKLDNRWDTWRQRRGNPREFIPASAVGTAEPVTLEAARHRVECVVDILCSYLLSRTATESLWRNELRQSPASSDVLRAIIDAADGTEDWYALLDEFAAKLDAVEPAPVPALGRPESQGQVGCAETIVPRALGAADAWGDFIRHAVTSCEAETSLAVPASVWIGILNAGGWTTEGPEGQGGDK